MRRLSIWGQVAVISFISSSMNSPCTMISSTPWAFLETDAPHANLEAICFAAFLRSTSVRQCSVRQVITPTNDHYSEDKNIPNFSSPFTMVIRFRFVLSMVDKTTLACIDTHDELGMSQSEYCKPTSCMIQPTFGVVFFEDLEGTAAGSWHEMSRVDTWATQSRLVEWVAIERINSSIAYLVLARFLHTVLQIGFDHEFSTKPCTLQWQCQTRSTIRSMFSKYL